MSYQLLLGQLVYTSFAATGFKTVASAQVPAEVQQAFVERVVHQYWNSYKPPEPGYRAVYIHQVTAKDNLFGWLYDDGVDDMGRSRVPYFLCYYLAEPLLFYFQLEHIFTCLHKGPVALINRRSLPTKLDPLIIRNFWCYEAARPGVAIPSIIRARNHIALKQGELLDLFLPVDEQEPLDEQDMLLELSAQTTEQQIANISIYTRYLVKAIETGTVSLNADTVALKEKVIQPYQGYKENLQRYERAFVSAKQREHSFSKQTLGSLKRLQRNLQLRNEDVSSTESISFLGSLPNLHLGLDKRAGLNSIPHSDRNLKLLLIVGIAATVLAFAGAMYGYLQMKLFAPSQPRTRPPATTSIPIFHKTMTEVPSVPQGIFNYGGSTTFAPLRSRAVVSAINEAHPRFKLRYIEPTTGRPGSGKGIKMLIEGHLSFAQSSRAVKSEEVEQAIGHGFALEQIPVAIDGIAVYVNPRLSLKGLTLSQLKDIYTGKITNWKAVGGPNLPITPFSYNLKDSGTVDFFYKEVLNRQPFGAGVREVRDPTYSIRQIAKTPGGIGYATASALISQSSVHPLPLAKEANQAFVSPLAKAKATVINKTAVISGSYPLTRRLFVVIKRDGGLDEQAGVAYANFLLTAQGQQLVEKAGFVPIR